MRHDDPIDTNFTVTSINDDTLGALQLVLVESLWRNVTGDGRNGPSKLRPDVFDIKLWLLPGTPYSSK